MNAMCGIETHPPWGCISFHQLPGVALATPGWRIQSYWDCHPVPILLHCLVLAGACSPRGIDITAITVRAARMAVLRCFSCAWRRLTHGASQLIRSGRRKGQNQHSRALQARPAPLMQPTRGHPIPASGARSRTRAVCDRATCARSPTPWPRA
jgi:hypothetical protein